jgi:hypothetical protein
VYFVGPGSDEVRKLYPDTPFKSLHVVWYEQEMGTLKWRLDYCQTDNLLSPWEVEVDGNPWVRKDKLREHCGSTPALNSPAAVIEYLRQAECGAQFKCVPPCACGGRRPRPHPRLATPLPAGSLWRAARTPSTTSA